ncbi:Uu.00g062730.m01.CDS01 [Anthostomella pinea]|uniref:Uu.00g062730.m01.CDS01 n=1 Tax=Anthostomella pinea TaxID=933095 RepID=A0AAI8VUG6_9PEZI|nr:Uu.00g062730.m01.CDS01 [Anthostomella pinea]
MARAKSSATPGPESVERRRSARHVKPANEETPVKQEESPVRTQPQKKQRVAKREAPSATPDRRRKKVKVESPDEDDNAPPHSPTKVKPSPASTPAKSETGSPRKPSKTKEDKAADLQAKKLKSYSQFANQSPFPDFAHPTPEECKLAHKILASLHGARQRPEKLTAAPTQRAGCGNSPSVLDALVRTILSQNTSDRNSTRAKLSMDKAWHGRFHTLDGGSDKWDAIVAGGQAKLQETIASGGLSVVKSRVIISILQQARDKYGAYSLDHLFQASDDDAMREMLAFQGVGPKTASCVLLFCLRRESFAVDTHVHRITGLLEWRPRDCSRDQTHAHLDARIPDEDKYSLHILIIKHGKSCDECKAGGKNLGKCELRKAFRRGKVEGEAGEEVKEEEVEGMKKEEPDVETGADAIGHAVEQAS